MFIQTRGPVRAETFISDGISTQNIVFNDKNEVFQKIVLIKNNQLINFPG